MCRWDYADMSSMAKAAGGPKELLTNYYNSGYSSGVKAQRTTDLFTGMIAIAAGFLGRMAVGYVINSVNNATGIPDEDVKVIEEAIQQEESECSAQKYEELINLLQDIPGYEEFSKSYKLENPDEEELELVKAFIDSLRVDDEEAQNE